MRLTSERNATRKENIIPSAQLDGDSDTDAEDDANVRIDHDNGNLHELLIYSSLRLYKGRSSSAERNKIRRRNKRQNNTD